MPAPQTKTAMPPTAEVLSSVSHPTSTWCPDELARVCQDKPLAVIVSSDS